MSWIIKREILKKKIAKQNKSELLRLSQSMGQVIKSRLTQRKFISDFPDVQQYLDSLFPSVNLSDIPIYMSSPGVMARYGFGECAGCYVPHMTLILVKDKIILGGDCKSKSKFDESMQKIIEKEIDPVDVIVHELIHAVSYKTGRSGNRKFVFSEEEFVYTNCVDFYRNQGKSNEEIVCETFLPFCINDVIQDRKQMQDIWKKIGVKPPHDDKGLFERTVEKNAVALVRNVAKIAKQRAHRMIDLYEQYGKQMLYSNIPTKNDVSLRISSMDMECDF